MARVSTDNEIVIRTWISHDRPMTHEYSYQLPNGSIAQGGFTKKASLNILMQNLHDHGYEPRLENGYYKQVWVPED